MKPDANQPEVDPPAMPGHQAESKLGRDAGDVPDSTPSTSPCAPLGDASDPLDQELLHQRERVWSEDLALACRRLQEALKKHLNRLKHTLI